MRGRASAARYIAGESPRRRRWGDARKLADAHARDDYRVWLRFRNRVLAAGTLEAFYHQHFLER